MGKPGRDLRGFQGIFNHSLQRSGKSNFQMFSRKSWPPIDFQQYHRIDWCMSQKAFLKQTCCMNNPVFPLLRTGKSNPRDFSRASQTHQKELSLLKESFAHGYFRGNTDLVETTATLYPRWENAKEMQKPKQNQTQNFRC